MSDTICREDAIKAIHNYWKKRLDTLPTKESECGEVYADIQQMDKILEHNKTLCNFINAIPSADRPQGWIPCSESVPNEYRTVLVTWEYAGKFYTATAFRETKNAVTYWASDGQPHYTPLNVVAWMPLPEPWKGADDE